MKYYTLQSNDTYITQTKLNKELDKRKNKVKRFLNRLLKEHGFTKEEAKSLKDELDDLFIESYANDVCDDLYIDDEEYLDVCESVEKWLKKNNIVPHTLIK